MGKALEKLLRNSRRGCIDNPSDIKDIMKKFSDLTLADVINMVDEEGKKDVELLAGAILGDEYGLKVDDDTMKEFGFLELLFLIDSTKMDVTVNADYINLGFSFPMKEPMWYSYMKLVHCLFRQGKETSDLFQMFFVINIRILFYYLELENFTREEKEEGDWEWVKEFKNNFYEKAELLKLNINCNSSIEDISDQAERIREKPWYPWKIIEDYEEDILNAYEIMNYLLVEPFRYLYPEKFTMEYILGTYGSWFTEKHNRNNLR